MGLIRSVEPIHACAPPIRPPRRRNSSVSTAKRILSSWRSARAAAAGGYHRAGNRAGGLEAGMTTGEPLVLRVAMKPIATLMQPLATVHLDSGEPAQAQSERSDVTAVPALGVIAEAMTALVLADALLEKVGGDSLGEVKRNLAGYLESLAERRPDRPPARQPDHA